MTLVSGFTLPLPNKMMLTVVLLIIPMWMADISEAGECCDCFEAAGDGTKIGNFVKLKEKECCTTKGKNR